MHLVSTFLERRYVFNPEKSLLPAPLFYLHYFTSAVGYSASFLTTNEFRKHWIHKINNRGESSGYSEIDIGIKDEKNQV